MHRRTIGPSGTRRRSCGVAAWLAVAVLLVGCGGSEPAKERAATAPTETPAATATPSATETPAQVVALEGRLGDATTAEEGGKEEVSPGGAVDPTAAEPTEQQQEGVGAGASCANVEAVPGATNDGTVSAAVLCLLNGERRDRGLGPLKMNAKLGKAANVQARDMVDREYFSHQNPEGRNSTDRIRAAGYMSRGGRWTVGENLAWGVGELASARGLVNAWMNSPPHRANILRSAYREIGIAIAMGTPKDGKGAPGATVATTFGVIRR
jgi:uncharacterized protein YkwD